MTITKPSRIGTARILWVDDQITAFGPHIDDLEDSGYEVIAVKTTERALTAVRNEGPFDAILVDLKMGEDEDGISLLDELYSEIDVRLTKVIVLSSFLYQPIVRRRLVGLKMNVALLEKTRASVNGELASLAARLQDVLKREDVARPASDHFTDWEQAARSLDPFEISYESYLENPMAVRLELDLRAQADTRDVRMRLAKEGVIWSVFCGSSMEPVETATEAGAILSDQQVFALASAAGHPAYEFYERSEFEEATGTEVDAVEESDSVEGCAGLPDYPFLRITVIHRREDNFAFNRSREIHFDSGLDMTAFDLDAALKMGLEVDTGNPAKFARYNGQDHAFYALSGDASVDRGTRGSLQVTISGRAYPSWLKSPFSRLCSDFDCVASKLCHRRHALLGRNLLVENALELDLRRIGTIRAITDNE
jgi:CheY-like chemotaxis protein